jgi:hypothetical protein
MFAVGVGALGAQAPQRTFVTKTLDAGSAAGVRLLGESVDAAGNIQLRVAQSATQRCATAAVTGLFQKLTIDQGTLSATLSVPSAWQVRSFRTMGADAPDASHTVLRLSVPMPSRNQTSDAVLIVGPDEGFPDVVLSKGSRALSVDECRATLATGESAAIVHATALSPDRGIVHYSLGYAAIAKGKWISFLGTAENADDIAAMSLVFRSLAVTAVR